MATENIDPEKAYFTAMADQDSFSVVIKAGAYVDHELIRLLDTTVLHPPALKQLSLDYAGRCALVVALGLDPRLHPPLKALGSIRNKLAHNPQAVLSKDDANNLYKALSGPEKDMVLQNYARTIAARGRKPDRFAEQSPLDRFVLIAIVLRSALVVARLQIERSRRF